MDMLWAGIKATAGIVGQAAVETGIKGKLQTELMLINREIEGRKRTFGEELYSYVVSDSDQNSRTSTDVPHSSRMICVWINSQEPLSKNPSFFASNDRMTETLRGPLLTAQREISALDLKRGNVLSKISQNETKEREQGAYVAGTTMVEKVQNAAIKTGYASNHAKLKTELAMVDTQIKDFKQLFGLELFQLFVDLEDVEGWLPTVRDIRSIYDQARRDIEKIQARRKQKEEELAKVGGVPMTNSSEKSQYNEPTMPQQQTQENSVANNYFHQAASAEAAAIPNSVSLGGATPGFGSTNGAPAYGVQPSGATPNVSTGFGANAAAQAGMAHSASIGSVGYGSTGVPANDPFQGSNMMATQPQLGPPPMVAAPDPFAPSAPQPHTNVFPSTMTDNSSNSFGSAPTMGTGGGFAAASPDPFASLGAPSIQPAPPAPSTNSDDPFSAFDSLQGQEQQQQTQPPGGNPLFRY